MCGWVFGCPSKVLESVFRLSLFFSHFLLNPPQAHFIDFDAAFSLEKRIRVGMDLPLSQGIAPKIPRERQSPVSDVVINEIQYDPNSSGEWVELYNKGTLPVDLKGWSLSDRVSGPLRIAEESLWVEAGAFLVLTGFSFEWAHWVVCSHMMSSFPRLNNDSDCIVLRDDEGFLCDSILYEGCWGGGDGISLERIDPRGVTQDPGNWAPSVSLYGSSPGRMNTVFYDPLADAVLFVNPNPFSPDGDGIDETTTIHYKLPWPVVALRIWIFDIQGRMIRVLRNGTRSGSQGSIDWDGKNENRTTCPIGIYLIFLEAHSDNRTLRKRTWIVVARRLSNG